MQQQILETVIRPYRPFSSLIFLSAFCILCACSGNDFLSRKYIATVNGEKIYQDEFELRLNAQKGLISPRNLPDSPGKREMLEEEVLESMITEKVVLQRARELNLSVSSTELENKILDIRKDHGEHFFDLLTAQNVRYEDWREELRKEMLFDKLVAADVNAAVRVSEDELEDYFNDHPELCKTEARVRAAQIVVRGAGKAKAVLARLENGEDFAKVAAEVSIGPESVRGGDLGLIYRQTMPEPLDKALFSLPVGKISPIVQSAYGFHIFKVTEIKPARTRSFPDCREDLLASLRAKKQDAAFTVWLEGLKIKAVVKKEPLSSVRRRHN